MLQTDFLSKIEKTNSEWEEKLTNFIASLPDQTILVNSVSTNWETEMKSALDQQRLSWENFVEDLKREHDTKVSQIQHDHQLAINQAVKLAQEVADDTLRMTIESAKEKHIEELNALKEQLVEASNHLQNDPKKVTISSEEYDTITSVANSLKLVIQAITLTLKEANRVSQISKVDLESIHPRQKLAQILHSSFSEQELFTKAIQFTSQLTAATAAANGNFEESGYLSNHTPQHVRSQFQYKKPGESSEQLSEGKELETYVMSDVELN